MIKLSKYDFYFYILIVTTVLIVYFIPSIKSIFLLFTLFLFLTSKKKYDYIWLLYTLVLLDNPGYLFWRESDKITPFASYIHIFSILALIKYFVIPRTLSPRIFFKNNAIPYFLYTLFLLFYGAFLGIEGGGQTGYGYLFNFIAVLLLFPLFITIPNIICNHDIMLKFLNLLFPLVLLNLIFQSTNLIIGQSLHTLLGGEIPYSFDDTSIRTTATMLVRPIYFMYGIFIANMFSLVMIYSGANYFNKQYLVLIYVVTIISVILSATRGWMIAFILLLLLVLIYDTFIVKKFQILRIFAVGLATIIAISQLYAGFYFQITRIYDRFSTIFYMMDGDVTAAGTNLRLTTRLDPVLNKFYESPIVGWGFSTIGMSNYDAHVGNGSVLLIGGVIGFLIIVLFLLTMNYKIYVLYKLLSVNAIYKNSLAIIIMSFLSLVVIHSSSTQVFGFYSFVYHGGVKILWVGIVLSLTSVIYNEALRNKITKKTSGI